MSLVTQKLVVFVSLFVGNLHLLCSQFRSHGVRRGQAKNSKKFKDEAAVREELKKTEREFFKVQDINLCEGYVINNKESSSDEDNESDSVHDSASEGNMVNEAVNEALSESPQSQSESVSEDNESESSGNESESDCSESEFEFETENDVCKDYCVFDFKPEGKAPELSDSNWEWAEPSDVERFSSCNGDVVQVRITCFGYRLLLIYLCIKKVAFKKVQTLSRTAICQ